MKKISLCILFAMLFFLEGFLQQSCAHKKGVKQFDEFHAFHYKYDAVWEAVKELLLIDMGCIEKQMSKKRGIIETTWVSLITPEGTLRWKIRAQLKRKKGGVLVNFDREVQIRDDTQENVQMYYKKQRDDTPRSKWKKIGIEIPALKNLYQKLENKLKK